MKISHNWLKQFIAVEQSPEEISKILTSIGLEVESIEAFQTIKGGLKGIVIGKVLTREKHSGADKLSCTTVTIGSGEPLKIVCGAPNVAAGQTVLVATIGTKLYDGDKEFEIKKSQIRGEDSFGMICAEDELGLGTSHDGIMVLPDSIPAGTLAKDYFGIESDFVYEIGLTPNRVDAASHLGVARDLCAYFSQTKSSEIIFPKIVEFNSTKQSELTVTVADAERCPRYAGVVIEGVKVTSSPDWLQNRLKAIGLKPINNIVDITNYILHELGQPLHAFDLAKVGSKVIVGTLPEKTKFKTLDGIERELSSDDLMICNEQGGMCIAGVFGGLESGVSDLTTSIFLESAYFNPVSIRKSARRHQLSTDASFRFERGIDPNITIFALKRAIGLIQEISGGTVTSDIFDTKPEGFPAFSVEVPYSKVDSLIGQKIERDIIKKILVGLGISIQKEENETLYLQVPPFKVDVQRPEDVIEEILRVYGYNSIAIPTVLNSSITFEDGSDDTKQRNVISNMLCASGFNEIMCNSITKADYFESLDGFNKNSLVRILNPLSSDLNVMRASLLFGMLETVQHNSNRQSENLKLYEFGRSYTLVPEQQGTKKYSEKRCLSIAVTGNKAGKSWNVKDAEADFYFLKSHVENVLARVGIKAGSCKQESINTNELQGLQYVIGRSVIVEMGAVKSAILAKMGIDKTVYYANILWDNVLTMSGKPAKYKELPKFFEVKRDLSMLIDSAVTFDHIKKLALETERNYLKEINVFDVYQGKGIPEGKKSYAVSFIIQDEKETMKDSKIEGIMNNLIKVYKEKLGAELR
jgi:phenylalanyl-tRNA synthetase beta chain